MIYVNANSVLLGIKAEGLDWGPDGFIGGQQLGFLEREARAERAFDAAVVTLDEEDAPWQPSGTSRDWRAGRHQLPNVTRGVIAFTEPSEEDLARRVADTMCSLLTDEGGAS